MSAQHRTGQPARSAGGARRRDALRLLAVVVSILGLLLTSSVLNLVSTATAADAPKKAVIVAGPVHSQTSKYKDYCKAIADAAEAQGMEVIRVFHPYAPASKVKAKAPGADLFVYCGHGNGWPSDYGPFQEDTKNGLGLDAADAANRSPNTVVYKGANWLRENIELAPNAVVILSHLSYASGNASSGMPIPSRDVAVQRVDNFANGFLSIGARAVWALGWQPGADIVDALHEDDATMDAVFMTHYRNGVNPLNGWIGWKPGYYDSERIPGAVVHIDPDPDYGFLRGVTGDLGFTTNEWRDASTRPTDVTPPVVNGVKAAQATVTIASAVAPVFTPNGDGISDSVAISFVLSEGAYVQVKVRRNGSGVRSWSTWAQKGAGTIKWDGRKDNGIIAAEGKYTVYITPTDRAGNKGEPGSAQVKILNSVHSPAANPALFWNRDGDALAPSATLKARLKREATVSWVIRDRAGAVVRRGIDKELRGPGDVRFVWDGRDDDGASTPDGKYTARIVAKTANGTYAHDVAVRHMPYKAWTTRWTRKRGDRITLKVTSAEPLAGKPVVTANQPGIAKYTVPAKKVSRLSSTEFKVVIQTRNKGKAGDMKVRVKGTDKGGGVSSKVFTLRLK